MTRAWQFLLLAFLVGMVQGGSQALEPLAVREHDPEAQVVGVFRLLRGVREVRPDLRACVFAAAVTLFGSSRAAVISVILFFVAGALVLTRVDVAAGEAQAAGPLRGSRPTGPSDRDRQ